MLVMGGKCDINRVNSVWKGTLQLAILQVAIKKKELLSRDGSHKKHQNQGSSDGNSY